ncbi:aliphatic sulfonate ABC transporter substrate-binding protein [Halotalea alkalilenta]|uniref:Putative aliphatic sulfonates-binding protein n=1 Tax=Halotalea alkalilenta TaxID=376489 RepID=A0A172YGL8_9GAMM|nr:aliphatic sulfonate ABC transporter substrate-binding protein [Halotalea alkalilenta]ANF58095.1 ABC transporter substrate-binding protein [Halotalea alkalilenta]
MRGLKYFSSAVCLAMLGMGSVHAAEQSVSIGYQRSSTLVTLLHDSGELDRRLAEQGFKIEWHEFTSGLPLLEALNVGGIDVSADVADVVPIFAQAAGAELEVYATERPSPSAQALLVKRDSPIESIDDLRGKRIAVTKGAGNHYFLLSALKRAGLEPQDVSISYLAPADARAAFERDSIDAWIAWEPFLTLTERAIPTRALLDGSDGLADYRRFYLASKRFADAHPEVLQTLYTALEEEGAWVKANPQEAAERLAPLWGGLDVSAVEQANQRRSYAVEPVGDAALEVQQRMADAFLAAGMLPRPVDARGIGVWRPAP